MGIYSIDVPELARAAIHAISVLDMATDDPEAHVSDMRDARDQLSKVLDLRTQSVRAVLGLEKAKA